MMVLGEDVAPVAGSEPERPHLANERTANRRVSGFGWEISHAAISRRPPISLYTSVARTESYTYDAKVRDLFIFKEQFLSRRAKP
jgi:hypothetical protein